MSCEEQQEEELEVLHAIYEGDEKYKKINATCFQYKFGEDGESQSFLVEIKWGEDYPEQAPTINMELFYNKHLLESVKEEIKTGLLQQTDDLLTTPMTYSLFEWVKDNFESLIVQQPKTAPLPQVNSQNDLAASLDNMPDKKKEKKEQLTKSQKRRIMDKYGAGTDRQRGWDWVDVVKHLSQTGGQAQTDQS